MIEITGYMLREALKQWTLKRDVATQQFKGSLFKFKNENKETPQKIAADILQAETALVHIQTAQMRYNLSVFVNAFGEKITLAEAIKLVGSAGRIEKMWRTAVPSKRESFLDDGGRDPGREQAEQTITVKEITLATSQAGKRAGSLRSAIATANATKINLDLDPALFE